MDTPAIHGDERYEEERREAEKTFYFASVSWLERLVSEAKKLPPVEDPMTSLIETAAAAWAGKSVKPEEPRRVSFQLVMSFVDLCRKFGEAELRAYAGLLIRRSVPPSLAVSELEKHAKDLLEEIRRRKWANGMEQISGPFDPSPWFEDSWDYVVKGIHEFVRDDLELEVWFEVGKVPDPALGMELDRVETGTRVAIKRFILRVAAAGRSISRKDIWTVSGYRNRTEFQRFQREDPRTTDTARRNFTRTLNMAPEAFIDLLKKVESKK